MGYSSNELKGGTPITYTETIRNIHHLNHLLRKEEKKRNPSPTTRKELILRREELNLSLKN